MVRLTFMIRLLSKRIASQDDDLLVSYAHSLRFLNYFQMPDYEKRSHPDMVNDARGRKKNTCTGTH